MAKYLRIQIAPVSSEVRPVISGILQFKTDVAYLIADEQDRKTIENSRKVRKALSSHKEIKVNEELANAWDVYSCIAKFKEIIDKEKENNNRICINVSTGTAMTAIAGALASMLWGIELCHAKAGGHNRRGSAEFFQFFAIQCPTKQQMETLKILDRQPGGKMRRSQLFRELDAIGVFVPKLDPENAISPSRRKRIDAATKTGENNTSRLSDQAKHSQLRLILQPMKKVWNLVEIEGVGRQCEIIITKGGKSALGIFAVEKIE